MSDKTKPMRNWIKRLLCALRDHAGIGSDSRCKHCGAFVDCRPREWR